MKQVNEPPSAGEGTKNSLASHGECLHELFEVQATLRPEALAIVSREGSMTYGQVEERSNQLAHYLRSIGVKPGQLVGLFGKRSTQAVITMLGILKAGGGYVPIDPAFPDERIRHILADAKVEVLVCEEGLAAEGTAFFDGKLVIPEAQKESHIIAGQRVTRIDSHERGLSPSDLCYIIYTSGTTGRPKGIMTEHRNVVAFTRSFAEVCRLDQSDRVYHGFSLGFDGSVEEIWMAFSAGATLVVGPPELAQLGDETARYMSEHGVTFFSTVPTFLAMVKEKVPSLRLVVVSGEQCPPELVRTWASNGRRMLNVYGPTETTVNTTSWDCVPDAPVTIGRPLSGYTTYILNEKSQPVAPGESGELYIGGVGVARGYLNQPELTRKHFVTDIPHANGGPERLYRTGDLVQRNESGELVFLGRIDNQVKIRGYRIELDEIESVLCEHAQIENAALIVSERSGLKELAAFVVPADNEGAHLDRNAILDFLRQRLPAYMVPAYLDTVDALPRLASGKINRRALPEPTARLIEEGRTIVPPETETEKEITNLWEDVFKTSPISIDDDFFMDLGGDSLLAASFVSKYRGSCSEELAIREIYRCPTVRRLAEHVESQKAAQQDSEDPNARATPRQTARDVFEGQSSWTRLFCYTGQTLALLTFYGLPMAVLVLMAKLYIGTVNGQFSLLFVGSIVGSLFVFGYPLGICVSILAKWVIIGRYKPGSYPLWGLYYFRWWLATRFQRGSGIGLLAGTPLINIYFRLMGARVGRGCVIHSGHCTVFDLVSIGDGSCIGSETQLLGYTVADGMLHIGTITVGKDCFVGIQSALSINSAMGDGARLDDLSLLAAGEVIPPGQARQGSPSTDCDVSLPEIIETDIPARRSFSFGVLSLLAVYPVQLFMLAASLPNLVLLHYAYIVNDNWLWAAVLVTSIPLFDISFWILHIVVKACVLRRSRPGVYPVDSFYFLRKWFVDTLMGMSRLFTLPVYTTLYMIPLLRMLGAKIGARAELSVIAQLSPDLVVMEEESFFADGSIIGGMRIYRGHFQLAVNQIGRRSFLGNSAVLPVGSSIGSNCLLGVLSSPPRETENIPDRSEWLGSPSFVLPHRTKVEGFSDAEVYKPDMETYASRLCVDALRIATASGIEIIGVICLIGCLAWAFANLSLGMTLALAPVAGIAITAMMVLCVVCVKKMALGTFEPVIQPLWSPYVWFNEVINGAHESVAAPLLSPLLGTPFFVWYLRLMGCKVGRRNFIETTLFGEFDLVEIGDYVALNPDVVIQNHLFEDRIFKASRLVIGDNCSIGNMSVVLYDSEMGEGSSIGSLSLLMKGESIQPRTQWEGIPIQHCTRER